ncbi:MAG TPA: cytochrome c [Rhizomicrobium sp.]
MKRGIAIAGLLSVVALATLAAPTLTQAQQGAPPPSELGVRGKYLAILGDCASCHTSKDGAAYAGGRGLNSGFGIIYSANITPDRETGIGNWSADQFYRAMHKGIAANDSHLYPAFPYPYFTHMTRVDDDAIYAYLRTIPAVHAEAPPNKLPFPLNIRGLMAIWNALYFSEGAYKPDPTKSAEWNRGAYIVTGPGHCGGCHTPKNFLMADENDRALSGNVIDSWFAADLSGEPRAGLASWTAADIEEYLKSGRNARATASGSMQEVIGLSTSRMEDPDRAAIAAYLKDLPPSAPVRQPSAPDPAAMRAGEAIFVDACSACHLSQGRGQPRFFPPLAGGTAVQSRDATTVLHIILQGSHSLATTDKPTPLAMPAFAWKLNDQQIADVATYIRNSWGNQASQLDAADVRKLRSDLAKSSGN